MAKVAKRRGRYILDFYDNEGKRKWITLPEGTTKKTAEKALRGIEEQLEKGVYLPINKTPTFAEVAKDWLAYKKPNLRSSTWSVYEGHARNHFQDLDALKINRISTSTIEKFIADRQKADMHILTLRKILVTLNQVMAYAVRHKYIDHNPVRDAERPKGKAGRKTKPIRILSPSEINALLNSVSEPKYRTLFELAIMSGARQGELLALRWSDVDWENSQICIRRTFNNGALYDPKTETSARRIDLGPLMMSDLKKWRIACPPTDLDLIFPNEAGEHLNHNNMVNRHFNPALKRAGVPRIRFHDLRHTYASLLIEQGENPKYIQTQLGHSSPTVTLNIYSHLMNPTNQAAACKLEGTLFQTTGSKMVAETQKRVTV